MESEISGNNQHDSTNPPPASIASQAVKWPTCVHSLGGKGRETALEAP